jgi:DNA-binding response OmpR family regulator
MKHEKLKILLIEDNPGDARLFKEELIETIGDESVEKKLDLEWVDRMKMGLDYLSKRDFDIVILDLSLPDSYGLENIEKVKSVAPNVPIIVLSGSADDVITAEGLNRGAYNYLLKNDLSGESLIKIMYSAVEQNKKEN